MQKSSTSLLSHDFLPHPHRFSPCVNPFPAAFQSTISDAWPVSDLYSPYALLKRTYIRTRFRNRDQSRSQTVAEVIQTHSPIPPLFNPCALQASIPVTGISATVPERPELELEQCQVGPQKPRGMYRQSRPPRPAVRLWLIASEMSGRCSWVTIEQ